MLKRQLSVAICVWLAASVAAFGQSYIFQLAGPAGLTNNALGLVSNDFTHVVSTSGALNSTFQVVSTPSGKFYIVAPGGIQSANAAFTTFATVSGIAGNVLNAIVTPDGKYLLVVTDQHLYVIDTGSDTVVALDPGVTSNGGTATAVAVSHDGKTAYVLAATSGGGSSTLTRVSLVTFQTDLTYNAPNLLGTSVTLSPRGLLYITFQAQSMIEIDPATMSATPAGFMSVPGTPGPPHFTPDGGTAYLVNLNVCPFQGCNSSILQLNVATHSFTGGVPADVNQPSPQLANVFVGGSGQIYAFSPTYGTTKLWDVQGSPLALVPSAVDPTLPINNVLAVAMSNERPSPRFLYVLSQDNNRPLRRIDLLGGGMGDSVGVPQSGVLWFDPAPALSGASSFFLLNPAQAVGTAAVSAPLIAQLVNSQGRPVFNQQVTFTSASSDLIINTPSQVTGADGFAQTTVTTSSTAQGSYVVQVTSGSASASFTVVVGTGTGTSPQMTIYSGDGQLLRPQNSTIVTQPLTVKLTDVSGNPLSGIPVTFTVTQGIGTIQSDPLTNGISGLDGLAASNFVSGAVDPTLPFQATTITASSVFGSVDFVEMTTRSGVGEPNQPSFNILTPSDLHLTIPQGGSLPSGIVAQTFSGLFPQGAPIPNLGIRLADQIDLTNSKIVSCAGSSRGDNLGISRCNVQAACLPVGTALPYVSGAVIAVGEFKFANMLVTITGGSAASITPTAGNGQTGHPGGQLVLLARVNDGCGQPVSGVSVSWSVTQGPGTATVTPLQAVSTSDGTVSARVVFGSTPGQITVQASSGTLAAAAFQLTNAAVVSSVSLVSGGGQSVVVGQAFPNPVVFMVRDVNGNPVPNLLVTFSVSGNATITPASATTNAQGQVQTSVTAGGTPDTIQVTATYTNFFATALNDTVGNLILKLGRSL